MKCGKEVLIIKSHGLLKKEREVFGNSNGRDRGGGGFKILGEGMEGKICNQQNILLQ